MKLPCLFYSIVCIVFVLGCTARNDTVLYHVHVASPVSCQFAMRVHLNGHILPMQGEMFLGSTGEGKLVLVLSYGRTLGTCTYVRTEDTDTLTLNCTLALGERSREKHLLHLLGRAMYRVAAALTSERQSSDAMQAAGSGWKADFEHKAGCLQCLYKEDNNGLAMRIVFAKAEQP